MRRREFLALPAAAALPGNVLPEAPAVAVVRLSSAVPFAELARHWAARGLPDPVRIVARAHPGWWPSKTELPESWRAWLELPDGSAVVVERGAAAGHSQRWAQVPARCRAARGVAAALSAEWSADV